MPRKYQPGCACCNPCAIYNRIDCPRDMSVTIAGVAGAGLSAGTCQGHYQQTFTLGHTGYTGLSRCQWVYGWSITGWCTCVGSSVTIAHQMTLTQALAPAYNANYWHLGIDSTVQGVSAADWNSCLFSSTCYCPFGKKSPFGTAVCWPLQFDLDLGHNATCTELESGIVLSYLSDGETISGCDLTGATATCVLLP